MTELTDKQIAAIEADIENDPSYWECVRETAETILATAKPRSKQARLARQHLAEAQAWLAEWQERERLRLIPRFWKWCKWTQTAGKWSISTPKSARPGDSARVQMSDGSTRLYRLDEMAQPGMWSGYQRIDVELNSAPQGAEMRASVA